MLSTTNQALNKATIVGKLLESTFVDGQTKDGKAYKRGNLVIRVEQVYGKDHKAEISEVPIGFIAMKLKKDGGANPGYESVSALQAMSSAQAVGIENADRVKIGTGNLQENIFVPRGGQKEVCGWQLRSSFFNLASVNEEDCATFSADIFILAMKPELDRESEETGRMALRAALVQYGGKVDVIDFVVENSDVISYIERHWEIGNTVNAKGRIRFITETKQITSSDSFGEEIPEQTTRTKKELIITSGSNEPKDEDFSYEDTEIKKGLIDRKAKIEQLLEEAKNAPAASTAHAPAASAPAGNAKGGKKSPYEWEE